MSRKVPENSAFAPMAEADELCDLLFLWLKKRKQCAEKLLALAKELEEVHEIKTASQVVGNATSVIALSTAGIALFLTGGLAAPLLFATLGTVAGAAVDITSTAIEAIISGNTMKEAKNIIEEDWKIGKNIQDLIENLKKKCGVQQSGAYGSTEMGCEVATQVMGALARRNDIDVPLDLLRTFIRFTFNNSAGEGLYADGAVPQQLISAAVKFISVQLGVKGLGKSTAYAGAKAASQAGFKVLGTIGFGISLYSFISSCEDMMKSNQGTKASRALRDASKEIREARRNLEEQLDAMNQAVFSPPVINLSLRRSQMTCSFSRALPQIFFSNPKLSACVPTGPNSLKQEE